MPEAPPPTEESTLHTTRALPGENLLNVTPLPKLGTGIVGLDDVLCGGFPKGRNTLIKGGPGAGKTIFALQFLVRSALRGTPGIFITFEERTELVRVNAATLGWDLAALERSGLLFMYHARIDPEVVASGPFSLKGLMAILDGKAKAMGASLMVIDAIDVVMRRFEEVARARDELLALHEWLHARQFTSILSVKLNEESDLASRFTFLDYLADCTVRLDHRVMEQISTRRLRVLKYRGSSFGTNEYPYVIGVDGISLVPIGGAHLEHRPLGPPLSSGSLELDAILGGGYRQSACVLIAGPSGSGKTTLAATFTAAACARGERVLYLSYEESSEAMKSSVLSAGVDLEPAVASGHLSFTCRMPESMGSDEHLFLDLARLDAFAPHSMVVDAISACQRMGSGKAAFDYCMRLVNACKQRGITCLLINQAESRAAAEDLSGLGLSALVDMVIQLKFALLDGELRRSLVVIKARGSKHSHHWHGLQITDDGIRLSPGPARASPASPLGPEAGPETSGGAR